jgi:hypothetical protein
MALRDWLPSVVPGAEVWLSSHDLEPGSKWHARLLEELAETSCGVVAATAESVAAPWVLFEAGAIAKHQQARLIPLLVGLDRESLPAPLQEFVARTCERQDILEIVRLLARPTDDTALAAAFAREWPKLEIGLAELPPELVPVGDLIESGRAPLRVVLGGGETRRSEPGEVNALARLHEIVSRRGSHHVKKHFEVRMGEDVGPAEIGAANVIFIGGPCTNQYVQAIMQSGPVKYLPDHPHRYAAGGREYANSVQPSPDGVFEDHAAMIRVPNPYSHSTTAVVLAGLSSRATEGCVRVISDGSSELDCYAGGKPFAAVVRSVHRHGHIVSAEVVWHQGMVSK